MIGARLRIVGGTIHDPANGVDGEVRDICIEDGRIVADVPSGTPTLDARGMIVMPGGVDIHSHVASSACNHARRLLVEEHSANPVPAPALEPGVSPARSGTGGTLPSTFTTGYRYAGLGTRPSSTPPWHRAPRATPTRSSTTPPSWMADSTSCWGTTIICSARWTPASATAPVTTRPG